jgi:hypothetical protein
MNIFILGRKYQGKSTLAIYLGREIRKKTHAYKLLVFDPKWQIRLFPHTTSIAQFKALLHDDEGEGITYFAGSEFNEERDDAEQVRDDFSHFCQAINIESHLRRPPERPLILILDEIYYLTKGSVHPWLARIIRLATEGKIYVILAGHRPQDLHPDIRGKGDDFYFFVESDYTDLNVVSEIAGDNAKEIVEHLPRHHIYRYQVEGQKSEIWDEPEKWYSEISKESEKHDRSFDAIQAAR